MVNDHPYPPNEPQGRVDNYVTRVLGTDDERPATVVVSPDEFRSAFVARAQKGDRAAREKLLSRLRPILHTYFIKRVGLKPEVEDLIQNTLLRVHRGLIDLQKTDRFMGFAMKAALYELHDLYRGRYSAREALYDPSELPEPPTSSARTGDVVDVEKALSLLSPRARKILELREYGYRYKEIADMVGSSEAAVKMQVKRAFERMRRLLVA